jgi:hypothetical protein
MLALTFVLASALWTQSCVTQRMLQAKEQKLALHEARICEQTQRLPPQQRRAT